MQVKGNIAWRESERGRLQAAAAAVVFPAPGGINVFRNDGEFRVAQNGHTATVTVGDVEFTLHIIPALDREGNPVLLTDVTANWGKGRCCFCGTPLEGAWSCPTCE